MVTCLTTGAVRRKTYLLPPAQTMPARKRKAMPESENEQVDEVAGRRMYLSGVYHALPMYGTLPFWRCIEETNMQLALPLETLVTCARAAVAHGDEVGRNRILSVIIARTQSINERWAEQALARLPALSEEREALISDVYADLCERIIRAVLDPTRGFWEEHFQHSLFFERKHVYKACLLREGWWQHELERAREEEAVIPRRVPRALVESLDRPIITIDGDEQQMPIPDERAQQAFQAVEHADVPCLVMRLPEKLKAVIWLLFWEGRTEKETATILGVSDRTIRNRLQQALLYLRSDPQLKKEALHG